MYVFKNLTDVLEFKKIRVVYQALIESIINYGIFIWRSTSETTIDQLKKIQNKILKIILKKTRVTTQNAYNKIIWMYYQ